MSWTSLRVAAVGGLALVALIALLLVKRPFPPELEMKAYFSNAMGLRIGAPVRLAGVDIGSVKTVRARPDLKEAPAEVVMILTSHDLRIPNDSVASLETAGVLGETYVNIDIGHASGPPIASNAVLGTIATPQMTSQELLDKVREILSRKCDCDYAGKRNDAADRASSKKNGSKLP